MWIFGNYIFEEGRILEQSGCEYYVIPLIFSLKENINFSVREIGEAFFFPLFYVVIAFCSIILCVGV